MRINTKQPQHGKVKKHFAPKLTHECHFVGFINNNKGGVKSLSPSFSVTRSVLCVLSSQISLLSPETKNN
jgi:hypothetical protein